MRLIFSSRFCVDPIQTRSLRIFIRRLCFFSHCMKNITPEHIYKNHDLLNRRFSRTVGYTKLFFLHVKFRIKTRVFIILYYSKHIIATYRQQKRHCLAQCLSFQIKSFRLSVRADLALGSSRYVAFLYYLFLFVILFSFCQSDLDFDKPAFHIHFNGNYRISLFRRFCGEPSDLRLMQQ